MVLVRFLTIGAFYGYVWVIEKLEEDGGSTLCVFSENSISESTSTSFERIPAESFRCSRDTKLVEI